MFLFPEGVPMRRMTSLAVVLAFTAAACKSGSSSATNPGTGSQALPPCHPGCFPAGTLIATPEGPRAIELIRDGEVVTLVGSDGVAKSGPVFSTFQTSNRLMEIRTDAGSIRTTTTQPLCLKGGGFSTAGDLKPGDVIWKWSGKERTAVRVEAVVQTRLDADVFNLVVGESSVFVADGFLARGKPPLESPR